MPADPASPQLAPEVLDEAEAVLLDALQPEVEFGPAELERLCAARPELASALQCVYAGFDAARGALQRTSEFATDRPIGANGLVAGRFHPLGEIGRGGMSIVLLAWDLVLRRKVALKCVHGAGTGPAGQNAAALGRRRARLVHEAQVLAQIDHPGIVPIHDVVRDEHGEVYVAMLRVRGMDLREVYRRVWRGDREWNLPRVVAVLQRACEAVAYAHRRGVIHRDLKPANVMVGSFGEAYVMDWGLARTRSSNAPSAAVARNAAPAFAPTGTLQAAGSLSLVVTDRDDDDSPEALFTRDGDVVGTPSYMSPEQASGRSTTFDPRCDVYSTGAMLYELLAGQAPFLRSGETRSSAEILVALRNGPPAPLERLVPGQPAELIAIASRAMARAPEQRYPDMLELAGELRAFLEGRVVRAHRTGAWIEARKWISRHRAIVAVLGALLLTLLVAGSSFAVLYRQSEQSRRRLQASQIDSQRRINALRGFAAAGLPATSFFEDFAAEQLHRRWVAMSRPDLVSVREGALVLRSDGEAQESTCVALDRHLNVIHGDFDLRVEFRLEGFEASQVPRAGRIASLGVWSLESKKLVVAIQREFENDPIPQVTSEQSYRSYDESTKDAFLPEHCVPAEDRRGAFRVMRSGGRVAAYYRAGEWRELFAGAAELGPVEFSLVARNWYAREPFEFAVESVELITSPPVGSASIGELGDDFDSAQMDPRYAIRAQAGIAAQVDGRLELETFAGNLGRVELRLDVTRWCIRGDFTLEVELDLSHVPAPSAEGVQRVDVQATGVDETVMGAIRFERSAGASTVCGWFHREERRRPWDRDRARVRIVRQDTNLLLAVDGPGGWETLVDRPHVSPQFDFGFVLAVASPIDGGGAVVTFDALRLSTLSPR